MSTDTVSVLFQSGDEKITMQGNPELMIRVLKGIGVAGETLKLVPMYQGADPIQPIDVQPVEPPAQKPMDFIPFYRKIDPQGQTDQMLVITHYYQKYQRLESLSQEDYDKAYAILRRVPIKAPTDLPSTIRNVLKRTNYLETVEKGQYRLTIAGEDHVDALIAAKQST
jgi:hypothetical protein